MEKSDFKALMKSIEQAGRNMKDEKLPGMRVTYREKPPSLEKLGSLKYKVVIYWSDSDKAYIAEASELPGCISDGPTYEKALKNILRIIAEWLETAKKNGRKIQKPRRETFLEDERMKMKTIKYHEPKNLLDVRAWKRKVSKEIETLGWAEFHKRSEIIGKDLRERIEKRRLEKLAAKR
jgi:predicted RNase H-like HicB family nuclease